MRIAYLLESTELCGGVKVVLVQAEALARRGHRVTVVSPDAVPAWFPMSRARFERAPFPASAELAAAEIRVATFWKTVPAAIAGARGPVFHLCQGFEGEFDFYRNLWPEIEAAYRLPTRKLAIAPSLKELLLLIRIGAIWRSPSGTSANSAVNSGRSAKSASRGARPA